jgi:hypothetical protein
MDEVVAEAILMLQTQCFTQTAEEYRQWLEAQLDFVTKRKEQISRIS